MTSTEEISNSFSKHAHEYDRYARIQQRAAAQIIKYIPDELIQSERPISILEIGCGTGMVSRQLVKVFRNRPVQLTISDISGEMIDKCRENLNFNSYDKVEVDFKRFDATKSHELTGDYDLIISGFTLQWFGRPIQVVRELSKFLRPDGVMIWSFLNRGSFPEWQQICKEIDVTCTMNTLPDVDTMTSEIQKKVREIKAECHVQPMHQVYPVSQAFFNSIRKIGAGVNRDHGTLNPADMRRLIHFWNASHPHGIEIKHLVAFMSICKV